MEMYSTLTKISKMVTFKRSHKDLIAEALDKIGGNAQLREFQVSHHSWVCVKHPSLQVIDIIYSCPASSGQTVREVGKVCTQCVCEGTSMFRELLDYNIMTFEMARDKVVVNPLYNRFWKLWYDHAPMVDIMQVITLPEMDVNMKTNPTVSHNGVTPLYFACQRVYENGRRYIDEYFPFIRFLIAHPKINLYAKNGPQEVTVLFYVCEKLPEITRDILRHISFSSPLFPFPQESPCKPNLLRFQLVALVLSCRFIPRIANQSHFSLLPVDIIRTLAVNYLS